MTTRKPSPEPAEEKALPPDPVTEPLQQKLAEAEGRGLLGVEVDPTPNSAYTLAGVTSGEATPETDADAAEEARKASRTA